MLGTSLLCLSLLSLGAWVVLIFFRGGFWRCRERIDGPPGAVESWPPVTALVPARNEAEAIGDCVRGLVRQRYPGAFRIVVIDDHSTDGTAAIAARAAAEAGEAGRLSVIGARALESGWAGKVWAMAEGHAHAGSAFPDTQYFWLTDADIAHDPSNLQRLVAVAERERLDLTSQMVLLAAEGFWAGLLIPAFVFFFQKLYPFAWVNDPARRTAAAAGGSMLLRHSALERIGGFARLRDAIIDDCALARAVKRGKPDQGLGAEEGGRIRLGLTTAAASLRPYHGLAGIWHMVARSAFTQLDYSPWLLAGTLLGMALLYWGVPVLALAALLAWQGPALLAALAAWGVMALVFIPTLRLYRRPLLVSAALPLAGLFYSLMTLASAIAYWRGRGGAWKGRTLPADGRAPAR